MAEPGPEAARAAHVLRDLAARRASGAITLAGGVRVHVRDGLLVRVDAGADSPSFGEHLVLSRMLSASARQDALRRSEDEGISFHEAVRRSLGWTSAVLADAVRKHQVRRLSRGLLGDDIPADAPVLETDAAPAEGTIGFPMGPALVEALAAGDDDEHEAPELPEGATFVIAEDADASWTGLGQAGTRRVAAADLADAWETPLRARSLRAAMLAGFVRIELPAATMSEPIDLSRIVLPGGEATPSIPELPRPARKEVDPLDEVEGNIVALELTDAAPPDVAAAWREAARIWANELSCPEEAARCERNACGSAPRDPEAHLAAARWSAAFGEHGLSAAQARVAAAHAPPASPTRTRALELLAIASWLGGDLDNAVETVAEGVWESPGDPALLGLGSRLLLEAERPEEAERWRREAASAKHEIPRLDAMLDGTSAIRTESPDGVLRELAARVAKDTPAAILAAIEAAIAPPARVKGTASAVAAALRRVNEMGEPALAAGMAIRALDATGNRSPDLRDVGRAAAEASGDARLLVAVLERHVAIALAATHRVELLARVADCWERLDRPLLAARALGRALTHLPADATTLERLAGLYVRAWDAERAIRTLEKLRELATTPAARADVWLRLATVAFRVLEDPRRARGYVERGMSEPSLDSESRARLGLATLALGETAAGMSALLEMAAAIPDETVGAKLATAAVLAAERTADPADALAFCEHALDRWPRWSPLLLVFERLVARVGASERASVVFERVAANAWGPNGRRAVFYREARLLERMGDPAGALAAFGRAFALWPGTGTVLAAIERLSETTKQFGALADAYARLASKAPDAATLVARLRRAAQIAEERMGDARGAFEHLLAAFKAYAEPGLEPELRRLALALADLGDDGPFDALAAALADRAERAWDLEERLPYVTSLARLRAAHGGIEDALATLAPIAREPEGRAAIETAMELARERGDERRVHTWLADLGVPTTTTSPGAAVAATSPSAVDTVSPLDRAFGERERTTKFEAEQTIKSDQPPLAALSAVPTPPEPAPAVVADASPVAPISSRPSRVDGSSPGSVTGASRHAPRSDPAPASEPITSPTPSSSPPAAPRASSSSLPPPQIWKSAEPEDEVRLAMRIAREPGQRAGAIHRLRALVRSDPSRASAIRALRDLLVAADALNESAMIGRVAALFDPDPAAASSGFGLPLNHVESAATAVADAETVLAEEIIVLVWEHARPLFRQELSEHGVTDLDRVTPSDGSSFARGLAACMHAVELAGTIVFRKRALGRRARAIVGPLGQALVIGDLDPARAADRFVIGRALEGARPSRAMTLALPAARGGRAMRAIGAAFGRTELSAETERDCISLAAALWQTVPSRVQRRLRTMLEERPFPDPDTLRSAARRAALRSGLLLAGDMLSVASELAAEEPSLVALADGSEASFVAACASSEALATLVRFSTSDAMLSMRWTLPIVLRAPGDAIAGGG